MDEIDEAELLGALRSGSAVDGGLNGAKRAVSAGIVRRCCFELRDQVDPRGLQLKNAVIVGCLDLAGLTVPFPLRFDACEFDCAPVADGAELFELSLTNCPRLPGLLGNGLHLRRDLDLSRSRVAGTHRTSASTSKRSAIWLCESQIGGRLLCAETEVDGMGGRSIQADRMQVDGSVRLIHHFRSLGEVRLIGARLGGSLDLTGAQIESREGPALDLADATIEGSVFVINDSAGRRPVIRGRLDMTSARISGRFLLRNATISTSPDRPTGSVYTTAPVTDAALSGSRMSVGAEVMLIGGCKVAGGIDMSMAEVSRFSIGESCALLAPGRTALDLTNAEIRALLRLDKNADIKGTVRLAGAVIHGTLALHGRIGQPEHETLIGGSAMTVEGDVYLDDLRAEGGAVAFTGARLGSLSARRAKLHNPGGYALRLSQAVVKGPVRLIDGFTSTGLVALNRTTIEGRLHFTAGSFTCPHSSPANEDGHAIEAISATVHGSIDLGWEAVAPSVDFTDLTTSFLADDPATWPSRFTIAGMTYDRFARPQGAPPGPVWDHTARCRWLRSQASFDSGPYEQAAKVFRQHGYTREAEQILIAQRRHARQVGWSSATWPRRALDAAHATIGYGYRPARVLWALAGLLILVAASLGPHATQATLRATNGNGQVYTTTGPIAVPANATGQGGQTRNSPRADACGDGQVRCFSPVLYAIDTVIPLISLDQRSTWYPDPHVRGGEPLLWWLNIATMLGWLLSSIFLLSLARLSRSTLQPRSLPHTSTQIPRRMHRRSMRRAILAARTTQLSQVRIIIMSGTAPGDCHSVGGRARLSACAWLRVAA